MQSADIAVTHGGGAEQRGGDSGPELGTALGLYFVTLVTLFGSLVLMLGTALLVDGLRSSRYESSCEDGVPQVERRPELPLSRTVRVPAQRGEF